MQNLYGASSVLMALQANKRRITKLLISEPSGYQKLGKPSQNRFRDIAKDFASKQSIPIAFGNKSQLDKLSLGRPNQGLILQASMLEMTKLSSLGFLDSNLEYSVQTEKSTEQKTPNRKFPFWLLLDNIVDPENLGSILRTSYFYGVDGVILTDGCAKLSPNVSKASAGALEINPPYIISSMTKFLKKVATADWNIFGTNLNAENRILIDTNLPSLQLLTAPTLLIVGNEGAGTRRVVDQFTTANLLLSTFPVHNQKMIYSVDSLNVSVATGILIQHILAS